MPLADQTRRVRLVRDGYGLPRDADLLEAVLRQQSSVITRAAVGVRDEAALDWATTCRALVLDNLTAFRAELDR